MTKQPKNCSWCGLPLMMIGKSASLTEQYPDGSMVSFSEILYCCTNEGCTRNNIVVILK